jgi:hypothetical protein
MTTAYHPQANGLTERFNGTLVRIMSKYLTGNHKNWDLMIPPALFAYRTAIHKTLRESPFYLLMGFEPRTAYDVALGHRNELFEGPDDYFLGFRDCITKARELAIKELEADQAKKVKTQKGKLKAIPISAGMRVLIDYGPNQAPNEGELTKFRSKRHGPYKIVEIISPQVVRVEPDAVQVRPLRDDKVSVSRLTIVK